MENTKIKNIQDAYSWTEIAELDGDRTLYYKKDGNEIELLYSVPYSEINIYSEDEEGNEVVVDCQDDLSAEVDKKFCEFLGIAPNFGFGWSGVNESEENCESYYSFTISEEN